MLSLNLLQHNFDKHKFITADFETESLSLVNARPWEIAWDVYNGYKKVESHQYYLNWKDLNVCKGAAEATNFNMERVRKEGKDPKEIVDLFNTYLYNKEYNIVGHNILGYDSYIHNTCMLELGYKTDYSFIKRIYDTLPLARAYRLNMKIPEKKEDFLAFQYSMLNIFKKGLKCKNSELAKEFGYYVDENLVHGGSYDSSLTWGVFINLVKRMDIQ